MRTGAIFARGSCRALKWMALVGMVFALGAGSAAAQGATFTGAEWTPESAVIKINMSAAVWTRGGDETAEDFTVTWGTPQVSAEGVSHTIPGARGNAATEFTVTLDKIIPTGAGGADGSTGITVTYTAPTGDDDINDRGILDNSADHTASGNGTPTVTENMDNAPDVPAVDAMMFRNGEAIDAFQLPAAKGNQPFTYLASNLPSGLMWDADGPNDDTDTTDDREISGTPDMVTDGVHRATYTVTDRGGQATSITFMITVNDSPDAPEMPTVTPTTNTSGSLDVMWDAPADNNSPILYYEVQHKATDATDWVVPNTRVLSGTSHTFTGLTDGTSYDFQVQAINAVGMSGYSPTGMGTPMASGAVPAAPAMPTVTAGGRGELVVSWTAPAANGSTITGYDVQYWMDGEDRRQRDGVAGTTATLTELGDSMEYMVRVRAVSNNGDSPWSEAGTGTTAPAPATPDRGRGQITAFELVGDGVSEKTIGGVERYHVPEGSQDVDLSVTVQWTHAEIAAIGYNTEQTINVQIRSGGALPNWVSWIDAEGDVHFPQSAVAGNLYGGVVKVKTPRLDQVPAAQRGSERHVKSVTGTLDVLILHDDHEAENDAFYIEAIGGNVDLNATAAVNRVTPEVVIEDDEDQTVTVKMGRNTSSTVYEGDSGDDVPTFTVAASPPRVDLPLEVRLDLMTLDGTTVSSAEISLSTSSMTLNYGSTDNDDTVTVHLPASDGNRVDDEYELQASVNVYSLASGGYETIPAATHSIKVLDRHKLPTLMVSPATATVAEGGMVELTLTINRNPSNTTVSSTEKLQYTQEEVSVMLDMGMGSTASRNDFSPVESVVFPKRERGSYTASMTVEVMATADNELDDMEMLVLDAMVAGSVAANGSEKDSHMGVSTLTIEEGTTKLVWPKSDAEIQEVIYAAKEAGMGDDMMFNPGEMIEIESAGALFNAAEGVTVSYTAMSDNDDVAMASVSGAMVTVTAGDMPGVMAHITITAHASMPAGAKGLPQTDPREASVIFPVEVGLAALSIMLEGPEDMNLVEGGMGGMVTATANRMVTADTTVTLMRDRSKSSADDMDFEAEPITILAGQMSGSTMVMATADDMMETVDNMPEELVLYGMAEGMAGEVTGEVKFNLWDAAVPALPIIAQLLLAAFLAFGGYRRYRRR